MNTEIFQTKRYVREGSPALSVSEYLEPVLSQLSNYCDEDKIIIKSSHPQENANEDDSINTAYARVLVQGQIKGYDTLGSSATVGFVYALDKQTPEFVTYSGHEVFACTNLAVYSDEHVHRVKDNHRVAHKHIGEYLSGIEKQMQEYVDFHNKLQQTDLSIQEFDNSIGYILRNCLSKYKGVGTSAILHAHKSILSPNTMYSMKNDYTNYWDIYNAITDYYSKKFKENQGLMERPLKTKELFSLFNGLLNN